MKNIEQRNKPNMDGVNLLISILVCYPEIGTLSFEPADDSLKMTFILGKSPEKGVLDDVKALIRCSILAYHMLEGMENAVISIKTNQFGDMVFLNVVRDVASLSQGEIALLSELMQERFGDTLVCEANVAAGTEEEGIIQEDFIDNMIGSMKFNHAAERLIGIREDGRVMVFNK